MILVSNAAAQTLEPGQSLTFTVLRRTGCSEFLRPNTSNVYLKQGGAYEIEFHGNVTGATAALPVQLSIAMSGSALPETTMVYTPAAANAVGNIGTSTVVGTFFPAGGYNITVTNTGANPIIVSENAALLVTRKG